jgi:hypothetical protein
MGKCLALALLIASLSAGRPALADPITDDVRCFVLTLQMMESQNATEKMAALMAHSYYLGKIDGRMPDIDLEERVIAELAYMSKPDFFRAEATRCGREMTARGQAEKAMGEDMKKRGLKAMQEENAR